MKVNLPTSSKYMGNDIKIDIGKWHAFINDNIDDLNTKYAFNKYIDTLSERNVPIILNVEHLSLLTGIKLRVIKTIIYVPNYFYYNYTIPKRNGSIREISSPYPALLSIQRWIYNNILSSETLSNCATGFIKKRSIIDNVKVHLNNPVLLKMDIKDFFPAITKKRVISVFNYFGYPHDISYALASLCCLNDCLPQGAPTSPMLSNIISKRLDRRLEALSVKLGMSYTRYVDDISFSGRQIPPVIISYIDKIIQEEGFQLNQSKTKLINRNRKKIITGISISSGIMTIPKIMKREIRKDVYYILKYGLMNHMKYRNQFDPIFVERLIGRLYFWKYIEPKNEYIINSINQLKKYSKKLDRIPIE